MLCAFACWVAREQMRGDAATATAHPHTTDISAGVAARHRTSRSTSGMPGRVPTTRWRGGPESGEGIYRGAMGAFCAPTMLPPRAAWRPLGRHTIQFCAHPFLLVQPRLAPDGSASAGGNFAFHTALYQYTKVDSRENCGRNRTCHVHLYVLPRLHAGSDVTRLPRPEPLGSTRLNKGNGRTRRHADARQQGTQSNGTTADSTGGDADRVVMVAESIPPPLSWPQVFRAGTGNMQGAGSGCRPLLRMVSHVGDISQQLRLPGASTR